MRGPLRQNVVDAIIKNMEHYAPPLTVVCGLPDVCSLPSNAHGESDERRTCQGTPMEQQAGRAERLQSHQVSLHSPPCIACRQCRGRQVTLLASDSAICSCFRLTLTDSPTTTIGAAVSPSTLVSSTESAGAVSGGPACSAATGVDGAEYKRELGIEAASTLAA